MNKKGTLYISFKNKSELEIENVELTQMKEVLDIDGLKFITFDSGEIINVSEVNYMQIIEGEEK